MKSILVVEDDENEREGLCRLLEHTGYEVKSAKDAPAALEKMQRQCFDLLLVDAWVPRINGLALISRLPDHRRPKTVLMTVDGTPETLVQSSREKAYFTIEKPFDPNRLLKLIESALDLPPLPGDIHVLSAQPNWVELRFPCEMHTAGRVEEIVQRLNSGLPSQVQKSVNLAFHEFLMNAVEWGGQLNPALQVQIDYLRTNKFVMCRIADPGKGFDPSEVVDETIDEQCENHFVHDEKRQQKGKRAGGYGIRLGKSLVDELIYNEPHNEVVIVKYLN